MSRSSSRGVGDQNPLHDLIHRPRPTTSQWHRFRRDPIALLARTIYTLSQAVTVQRTKMFDTADESHSRPRPDAVAVVCISDTHNSQPVLPAGDILIHAGDLTQSGTFEEIQAALNWLKAQSHAHKIVIAGNHDLLLDRSLDEAARVIPTSSRERKPGRSNRELRESLDWGDVIYLENSSTTIIVDSVPSTVNDTGTDIKNGADTSTSKGRQRSRMKTLEERRTVTTTTTTTRSLKIFGSPQSPKHGNWAFQYPRDKNIWSSTTSRERGKQSEPEPGSDCVPIPPDTDILITHCPPLSHLDAGNLPLGCIHLLRALWGMETKPMLHVFGHIHAGYGIEQVHWDRIQTFYERCLLGSGNGQLRRIRNLLWLVMGVFGLLVFSAVGVVFEMVFSLGKLSGSGRVSRDTYTCGKGGTLFVNAAVVGGWRDDERRKPIKVWIEQLEGGH